MKITNYAHWIFPVFDKSCNKTSLKFTFIQITHKIAIIDYIYDEKKLQSSARSQNFPATITHRCHVHRRYLHDIFLGCLSI